MTCNECGREAGDGSVDPHDGLYYCAACWTVYEPAATDVLLTGPDAVAPSSANGGDAAANAARNRRDMATLRSSFPAHCSYHVYHHHVRGHSGCSYGNTCRLKHERPEGLDAALPLLEWKPTRS